MDGKRVASDDLPEFELPAKKQKISEENGFASLNYDDSSSLSKGGQGNQRKRTPQPAVSPAHLSAYRRASSAPVSMVPPYLSPTESYHEQLARNTTALFPPPLDARDDESWESTATYVGVGYSDYIVQVSLSVDKDFLAVTVGPWATEFQTSLELDPKVSGFLRLSILLPLRSYPELPASLVKNLVENAKPFEIRYMIKLPSNLKVSFPHSFISGNYHIWCL
jgi:hypothetical protein